VDIRFVKKTKKNYAAHFNFNKLINAFVIRITRYERFFSISSRVERHEVQTINYAMFSPSDGVI